MTLELSGFRAASEAAERWTVMLADCRYWVEHDAKVAFAKVYQLRAEMMQHGPVLDTASEQLAAFATGVFSHDGPTGVQTYASAHEAIAEIVREVVFLVIDGPGLGNEVLPADWERIAAERVAQFGKGFLISHTELQARIRQERAKFLTPAGSTSGGKGREQPARRTGRPRKGESNKEQLVIGALNMHHRYEPGGSIENYEPAQTKILAKLASGANFKVSVATVSRFFQRKFPNRGYRGYTAACNRDARQHIGLLLAVWQGEAPEHLTELLSQESGREEDD